MSMSRALLCLCVTGLSACGSEPRRETTQAPTNAATDRDPAPVSTPAVPVAAGDAAPTSTPLSGPLSCAADIGAAAAEQRVKICRNVSPATHPPCNAANSCAMIEDEIARSCALFDGKGPPMTGCTPAPKSMEAAAAVIARYYSALNARDYGTAWQQWGEDGPAGQSLATFSAGFAHTRATRVTIGTLSPGDAGAGSIYQTVPVTVDATLDDGHRQRFTGDYVVRRVNDVDGASAAQLRWHIGSARLKPVTGPNGRDGREAEAAAH